MSRPTAGVLSVSKGIRLLLAFAMATVSMVAWSVLRPTPAYAADDQIESFDIRYVMNPSGVLSVTETIVWRFGDSSGRHGIERYFITREPYDDQQDAVYGLDITSVTSSGTSNDDRVSGIRPASIRVMSRMSLINASRCCELESMRVRLLRC